jgi:hypothetical protein
MVTNLCLDAHLNAIACAIEEEEEEEQQLFLFFNVLPQFGILNCNFNSTLIASSY